MNAGLLFQGAVVCLKELSVHESKELFGIVDESGSTADTLSLWTWSQVLPLKIPRSTVDSLVLEPPFGPPFPYGSEARQEVLSLGVIGKHEQLQMLGEPRDKKTKSFAALLISDSEAALQHVPDGCSLTTEAFHTSDKWRVGATIDLTKTNVRAATLAFAKFGVGVVQWLDEDAVPDIDRFLCERLSRLESGWPASPDVDRASLRPLKTLHYWLPLCVPPLRQPIFTPEALGRRVARLSLLAACGRATEVGLEAAVDGASGGASATPCYVTSRVLLDLEELPAFASTVARAQLPEAMRVVSEEQPELASLLPDMTIAEAVQAAAVRRLPMVTAKISDDQRMQLCRSFVLFRDGDLLEEERRKFLLLFRVAQLHGYSPRQLGSFRADCGLFRGLGESGELRAFKDTRTCAPESVARLRAPAEGSTSGAWAGAGRKRGRRGF